MITCTKLNWPCMARDELKRGPEAQAHGPSSYYQAQTAICSRVQTVCASLLTRMVPSLKSSPESLYTMDTKSLPRCRFLSQRCLSPSLVGIRVAMWKTAVMQNRG